jgi:hypothetical protein
MNKRFLTVANVLAIIFCVSISVSAQRSRTRTVNPKTVPAPVVTKTDFKSGQEKVSIQIKNTTKFLFNLGGIAKGIEDIDKAVKERKASREVASQNAQYKKDVIQSIRNLRAGLVALEVEFRTKPELKPFLFQIQGISDISGTAEDQALSGQFYQSGKTLLFVVEKLADTLASMPAK